MCRQTINRALGLISEDEGDSNALSVKLVWLINRLTL
jgi:hypothetical protein